MESTGSCKAVRIMTHEEFAAKHPHPPSPVYVNIDRQSDPTIDRHQEIVIDRQPQAPIDRRAPITYRVQMPKRDAARLNALRPKPKPSENPPETVRTPSDDGVDPMEVDRVPKGRTLRKRKEKVAKHLKRGATKKEKEIKKPQTTSRRINDPGIIAVCHCGTKYETEYSVSIETHTAASIDSAHHISTDTPKEESVDSSPDDWENDYYMPLWQHTPCIQKLSTSIDAQPHQPNHFRVSTDNAYFPSIDTNVDATRDEDYLIGSWADNRYHESYAVETAYRYQGDDELNEGFTYEELLNMQRRDETDQNRAATAWKRTCFSHPIDMESCPSIDTKCSQSIDINNTTLIDIRPKPKTTGPRWLRKSNRRTYTARIKGTKEFYDTAGCIDKSFKRRTRHPTQPSIDVDVPTSVDRRPELGRRAFDLFGARKFYWKRKMSMSLFTQTELIPEIYTKDEINEMLFGVCGEHEKNKEAFQMKLDGVYYPLNDSISWLMTCMEEMKQDA
ncbi:hypothetical protein DY000_02008305 [Brassica cretica]|uniref:Uncharacterized protein n=1 Tax=Brassica cretica TaxID=69181 RepID=A0ABQ7CI56_BRACR|nr:hypothetical protein DY000_02008305 [Brassica cretica]